jgi:hypothetical protein
MSKNSYVRVRIPENISDDGVFQDKFWAKFDAAAGKRGARIYKIANDAFNTGDSSLLCLRINGHMTQKQAAYVARPQLVS